MSRKQDPLSVEYILLGIIKKKPIHAYDLAKILSTQEELRIIWHFNQSQLYAILDKIEKNGLIQSKIISGDAFPFKKVYSLTDRGNDMFQQWKLEPVQQPRMLRSDFLAKLYFLKDEPQSQFSSVIEKQIAICEKWLLDYQKRKEMISSESLYPKIVFDFRIKSLEAMISWLQECIEMKQQSTNL